MSNTERTPLVAVVGPTASGKTALAVELVRCGRADRMHDPNDAIARVVTTL